MYQQYRDRLIKSSRTRNTEEEGAAAMLIGDVCGIRRWLARAYYQSLLEACWNERPTSGSIGRVVICEKGTTVKPRERKHDKKGKRTIGRQQRTCTALLLSCLNVISSFLQGERESSINTTETVIGLAACSEIE